MKSQGNVYTIQDVKGDVMIAEFKAPGLADEIAAISARVEYLAMMSNVEFGKEV